MTSVAGSLPVRAGGGARIDVPSTTVLPGDGAAPAPGGAAGLGAMSRYRFTLFVAGDTARSQRAYASLRRICRERLGDEFEIELVDVVSEPEKAEAHRILTTPTVLKEHPEPRRRITGDLSDATRVMAALGMEPGWPDLLHPA